MAGIAQPRGTKGSLKWIQIAVNDKPAVLDAAIRCAANIHGPINWRSPLCSDGYAEYRDAGFLQQLDCSHLKPALTEFWPQRGPQWDGLAMAGSTRLLLEAKSHISEMCTPQSTAGTGSKARILASLARTSDELNANPAVPWGAYFYQLANRMAHLWFLSSHGIDARLVLLNFLDDLEQGGPHSAAEWEAAYELAGHVLGLPKQHKLTRNIVHVHLSVRSLMN